MSTRFQSAGSNLVLFMHGLGCAKESFGSVFDPGSGLERYSLLAPDLPGHGDTPVTGGFSGSMEGIADTLHRLLQNYRFETLHIVAHSMGGAAGLLLADRHDLPLASFTNIEGNLVSSDCGILSRSVAEMRSDELTRDGLEEVVDRFTKSRDPAVRQWLSWIRNTDPHTFHANAASLVAWSDGGELLDIFRRLPVTKSYFYGQRTANSDLLPRLVGIPTKRFDGCGHFPMIEQPGRFCQALEALLADARPWTIGEDSVGEIPTP